MALFPQTFIDDLKAQTDIVSVIGDVVPLKKAGRDVEGAVSVPRRKNAVVHGEPRQERLLLLWLQHRR